MTSLQYGEVFLGCVDVSQKVPFVLYLAVQSLIAAGAFDPRAGWLSSADPQQLALFCVAKLLLWLILLSLVFLSYFSILTLTFLAVCTFFPPSP